MSFSFGSTPKTASGFTLPTSTPATTTPSTEAFQFNLGAGSGDTKPAPNLFSTPTGPPGLTFGQKPAVTTAPSLNFGTPTTQPSALNLGAPSGTPLIFSLPPATSSAPLQFGTSTSGGSLSFGGSTPTATKTSFAPILGASTAASTGLTLGASTSVTSSSAAPKLSFGLPSVTTAIATTSAPAISLGAASTTNLAPTTAVSTTVATIVPGTSLLTFAQLEDNINKWTIDLEEQGKFFINQAKQLNAWDTLLISNGEKIVNLNSTIQRVKQQQGQLDQELDFILAQQKELEELIAPLERELLDIPVTDIDRNQMYQYSEVIDSQLKQMSDDLKEIIENINESNKDEEVSNPIIQISKILNAHMNSLQWIDRNTSQISGQLEQISKIQEANRRNLGFNSSFNNSINM